MLVILKQMWTLFLLHGSMNGSISSSFTYVKPYFKAIFIFKHCVESHPKYPLIDICLRIKWNPPLAFIVYSSTPHISYAKFSSAYHSNPLTHREPWSGNFTELLTVAVQHILCMLLMKILLGWGISCDL